MQSPQKGLWTGKPTYFASVEVLDDGEVQVLLALPFCLHGVGQELPEGPIGPFEQLVIQQEGVCSLCKSRGQGMRQISNHSCQMRPVSVTVEKILSPKFHHMAEKCPESLQRQVNEW
jgi:hypothetical protein